MKQKLLLLFMLALLPLSAIYAEEDPEYLEVMGKRVTTANAANILKDGAFSYDFDTKTLYVKKDVTVDPEDPQFIIYSRIHGLTINVTKDVTFESESERLMIISGSDHDMTITGPGKLTMVNPTGFAGCIYFSGDATLTIDNANIDGTGQNVIWGNKENEKLVIKNSTIKATCSGSGFGAIFEIGGGVTFDGSRIAVPEEGYWEDSNYMGIVDSKGKIARDILIEPGHQTEYYKLWICGTHVSELNADNILGDGVFGYNAESNTLTVGGNTNEDYEPIIISYIDDLTIDVVSDSELKPKLNSAISVYRNTTITGQGKLTLESGHNALSFSRSLTIENANVAAKGNNAIYGSSSSSALTIRNSNVYALSTNEYRSAIFLYGSFNLVDCYFSEPESAKFNETGNLYDYDNNLVREVLIEAGSPPEEYKLTICEVKVNSKNAADVLGDGVFSYDPETKTLTVKGDAYCEGECVIRNMETDLWIDVAADAKLESKQSAAIICGQSATISGAGKLTLKSTDDCGLYAVNSINCTLTIENITLEAEGKWGLAGYPKNEHLVISNANVHAKGTTGAITDWTSITLDYCKIVEPTGGYVDEGKILAEGGAVASEVVIEADYPTAIEGVATRSISNPVRYNLSGQRVDQNYQGIVIENGKKLLVK